MWLIQLSLKIGYIHFFDALKSIMLFQKL